MLLSTSHLSKCRVEVNGDNQGFRFVDRGYKNVLFELTDNPELGDYVVHLSVIDDEGYEHEKIYRIVGECSYRFLNRITFMRSLNNALRCQRARVLNCGLYYSNKSSAYIHGKAVIVDLSSVNKNRVITQSNTLNPAESFT